MRMMTLREICIGKLMQCHAVVFSHSWVFFMAFRAVKHVAKESLDPDVISPYNTTQDYQRWASTLALNTDLPPTTIVSDDGMHITYRNLKFSVATWRHGLKKLATEIDNLLSELCMGLDIEFRIPDLVPDDWTVTARQYSWLNNARFVKNPRALLKKMLEDPSQKLAYQEGSQLQFRSGRIRKWLNKTDKLIVKLALYAYFTAGQTPRVAEFIDHKISNSIRPRTMFWYNGFLWLVTRRTKTESQIQRESFIPMKCHRHLTEVFMKYLAIIRPVEAELVQYVEGPQSRELYREFMWVKSGARMPVGDLYNAIRDFHSDYVHVEGLGSQAYRQIAVEIGRIFIGSEAQVLDESDDIIADQAGHSARTAQIKYSINVGFHPGMSSDRLGRFEMASDLWAEVTGFRDGHPPMLTLAARKARHSLRHPVQGGSIGSDANNIPSTGAQQLNIEDILSSIRAIVESGIQSTQAMVVSAIQSIPPLVHDEVRNSLAGAIADGAIQQQHQIHSVPLNEQPAATSDDEQEYKSMSAIIDTSAHVELEKSQPVMMDIDADLTPMPSHSAIMDSNAELQPRLSHTTVMHTSGNSGSAPTPRALSIQRLLADPHVKHHLDNLLRQHFKSHDDPRYRTPTQYEAVCLAVERKHSFVAILPTGSGKSLVFTIPPINEPNLRTYVIVPSRALLQDHLARAEKLGISAAQWLSGEPDVPSKTRIVFIAMETATVPNFYE